MEDRKIIELYFAREEAAIMETDKKYGKLCFNVAQSILRSNEDSEECVNDTFYTAWSRIPPQEPSCFKAFLCKITRNLSLKKLDYHLAKKRNPELLVSFEELEGVLSDDGISETAADAEIAEAISRFLKTQTKECRVVFVRKYWYFDSVEEISQAYGFTQSKVKSMLHRTRNHLREYLRKEGISC